MSRSLLIGIAGGTGSGKTTVARQIRRALSPEVCAMVDHDSYYRDLSYLDMEERQQVNFDHPDALDNGLLAGHLATLRRGEPIEKPLYDFASHTRRPDTETIRPAPVIILEGILVLVDARLREQMDVKIFVDTDTDVRMFRRIRRDMDERGRTFAEVRAQYFSTVRPMHLEFVAPSRAHADLIIPEGGRNPVAMDLVVRAVLGLANDAEAR